jgi:hypothetical protein
MTKRFFIGYSLITFFLLNSVVLLAQHKASFVQQWKIEDASHALQIIERADTLELIVPDGLTMWYRQRLTGDYEISYRICMVMQGGKYDRLDAYIDFYQKAIEQNKWYGFWNYGDVMHAYDPVRHTWRYDVGGFAWDNTELASNMWLWWNGRHATLR